MKLVNDPKVTGVVTVVVAAVSAFLLGVAHLATLGAAVVGGLVTLRAALKK